MRQITLVVVFTRKKRNARTKKMNALQQQQRLRGGRLSTSLKPRGTTRRASGSSVREGIRAAAKNYKLTLLPGDGIGPEIMKVAVDVLHEVGRKHDIGFTFEEKLVGGAAIDAFGTPLPEDTLECC